MPARLDLLLALALFALAAVELLLGDEAVITLVPAAVFALPVAFRRRLPLVAAAALLAAPLVGQALDGMWEIVTVALYVALLIVQYSVAAYGTAISAVAGGAAGVRRRDAVRRVVRCATTRSSVSRSRWPRVRGWRAGSRGRCVARARSSRRSRPSSSAQREATARLAVAEERARWRASCNDAIAHSVSAMVIQGAAAEAVLPDSPAEASRSLRMVQALGRESVTELRRMLRILRTPATTARPAPSPRPARAPARAARRALDVVARARLLHARRVGGRDAVHLGPLAADGRSADGAGHASAGRAAPLPGRGAADLGRRRGAPSVPARPGRDAGERDDPRPHRALHGRRARRTGARGRRRGRHRRARRGGQRRVLGRRARLVPVRLHAHRRLVRALRLRGAAAPAQRRAALHAHRAPAARRRRARPPGGGRRARRRWRASCTTRSPTASASWCSRPAPPSRCSTSSPEQAREAAHAVQDVGRTVLERAAAAARRAAHRRGRQPAQRRSRACRSSTRWCARVRRAGLPVELRVDGEPAGCAPGVDASAYRVIQEALTNVLKHAGHVATAVTVRCAPTALALEVLSDGRRRAPGARDGHGLVGHARAGRALRRRAGRGPGRAGGFAVRAPPPAAGTGA